MNVLHLMGITRHERYYDPDRPSRESNVPVTGLAKVIGDALPRIPMAVYQVNAVKRNEAIALTIDNESNDAATGEEGWEAILTVDAIASSAAELEIIMSAVRNTLAYRTLDSVARSPEGVYEECVITPTSTAREAEAGQVSKFAGRQVYAIEFSFTPN